MDWGVLANSPCGWLAGGTGDSGVVLSSRIRLARNLAGEPFPQRSSAEQRASVLQRVLGTTARLSALAGGAHLPLEPLALVHRQLLGERQIASRDLIEAPAGGGVAVAADQLLACLVNEEDHLRLQALRPGLDLEAAAQAAATLEAQLGAEFEYARSARLGFLTACPTNVGTGMRASLLVHLPGMLLAEQGERLHELLRRSRLTIRGFYGEGSAAHGYIFQISNAATLGVEPAALVAGLAGAARELCDWESQARQGLFSGARSLLEDKIWRSFGILRHARLLTAPEAFLHASLLRLGAGVGLVPVSVSVLNEILIQCQPAHAQLLGRTADAAASDAWRAEMVRGKLPRLAA